VGVPKNDVGIDRKQIPVATVKLLFELSRCPAGKTVKHAQAIGRRRVRQQTLQALAIAADIELVGQQVMAAFGTTSPRTRNTICPCATGPP
jgi:hypothetical protein